MKNSTGTPFQPEALIPAHLRRSTALYFTFSAHFPLRRSPDLLSALPTHPEPLYRNVFATNPNHTIALGADANCSFGTHSPHRQLAQRFLPWRLEATTGRTPSSASPRQSEGGKIVLDALARWRWRMRCWWLALPLLTQAELQRCTGALALHLGSRLEVARHAAQVALGANPELAATTPEGVAEPGCEWILDAPDRLQLPAFPELPPWHGAPMVPLMRVLPDWRQLWRLSEGQRRSKERLAQLQLMREPPPQQPWAVTARIACAGAAGGLMLVVGLASRWMRPRGPGTTRHSRAQFFRTKPDN